MKPIALAFLLCELADLLTTWIGMNMGMIELNPLAHSWGACLTIKAVVIVIVVVALQRKRPMKADVLIPIVAGLPVVWNLINILIDQVAYLLIIQAL